MAEKKFTVESARVVHQGAIVHTEVLNVRTPEGDIVERQVVRHPGAVAVVAVHQGDIVLVEQYRAALDANLLEIPAGKRDIDGEALEIAAGRELIEEVGLEPRSLTYLGTFFTAAGFSDEDIAVFYCDDATDVGRSVDGVEEAHSIVHRIPVAEIGPLLVDGRINDAKTLIGLYWARDKGLIEFSL